MTLETMLRETTFDPLRGGLALAPRLLQAASRPGCIVPLGDTSLAVPEPAHRPACALLLTVLDRDVTFHVTGRDAGWLRDYLRFNTGARATTVEHADFLVVTAGSAGDWIERVRRAGPRARAGGATVVYLATSLSAPPARAAVRVVVEERGGWCALGLAGVVAAHFERLECLSDGIDVWLVAADGDLAVLPRSTPWTVRGVEALAAQSASS